MQDEDIIQEFLVESHENLSRLDQELVELERRPKDAALLASIFRTMHTIKGTCGFLNFSTLEQIAHQSENLLSQLREGQRELDPILVSLILETVDATRKVLTSIEITGTEGPELFEDLTARLRAAAQGTTDRAIPPQEPEPSEPPELAKPEEDFAKPGSAADTTIRVTVGLLDKLMDLVGELVLTRNQILQFNAEREDAALNATSQRLNLITAELQEGVMKTRMQPIGMVWNKLPRVVRDVALALGKQIRLEMDGTETELDRTIIETIKDPLVHLVRNACDHGIEAPDVRIRAGKPPQGRLTLRAYHEGGQVNIEISDDGAGIDVNRVKQKAITKGLLHSEQAAKISDREAMGLVFEPGISTADTVTNMSGRGVGMDVVKSNIERIGGVVDILSRLGEGTTVKLKIPLTLAIIPGLVVTSGGERFVIPQVSLLELIGLEADAAGKRIEYLHGTPVYRRRGSLLPVAYLNRVLGLEQNQASASLNMVVLQAEDRQFGLVVDGINDTQEIVVKPLGKQLKGTTVYAGSTIMGDGRVALILDVLGIGQSSGVLAEPRQPNRVKDTQTDEEADHQRLLLFSAGSFQRLAVPLSLVARLEEFPRSSIERAGGSEVVQYRNSILPLISLRDVLECDSQHIPALADPAQVIVFNDRDRSIGVVIDRFLDISEEAITARRKCDRKGLLGSAVVGGHVTDFLDLSSLIAKNPEGWFQDPVKQNKGQHVLVAEASPFSRSLIRGGLDMAGYRVTEAGTLDEAIDRLEQQPIDLVVAELGLPPDGCAALTKVLRSRPEWNRIPLLALADSAEQVRASTAGTPDFEQCLLKFEHGEMLESLLHLRSAVSQSSSASVCVGKEE